MVLNRRIAITLFSKWCYFGSFKSYYTIICSPCGVNHELGNRDPFMFNFFHRHFLCVQCSHLLFTDDFLPTSYIGYLNQHSFQWSSSQSWLRSSSASHKSEFKEDSLLYSLVRSNMEYCSATKPSLPPK